MRKYLPRRYYSEAVRALMWDRWQKGESLHTIGRLFERSHTSVRRILAETGGIRPAQRKRSRLALTLSEREEISRGTVAGHSIRSIATALGRSPSTVSRELHETIYRSLFIQARGALKKELLQHLRSRRTMRRSRHKSLKGEGLGQITDTVSIRERPAMVEDRAVPGHWEGDLVFGSKNSQIATLVERHSRYVVLVKVDGKDTKTVINALIKQAHKLPRELYKSLTWDRGSEMADHKRFTLETNIQVYFCDPRSPWQRGSNENTNRLLRQYFPKGLDLSANSQAKLNAVARQLNERPRKTLNYETPAERFSQCVASTG